MLFIWALSEIPDAHTVTGAMSTSLATAAAATRVQPCWRAARRNTRRAIAASATRPSGTDGDDGHVDDDAGVVGSRRAVLAIGVSALASPLAARAEEAEEADPWEGSYVKPALTVPEYIDKVRTHA